MPAYFASAFYRPHVTRYVDLAPYRKNTYFRPLFFFAARIREIAARIRYNAESPLPRLRFYGPYPARYKEVILYYKNIETDIGFIKKKSMVWYMFLLFIPLGDACTV